MVCKLLSVVVLVVLAWDRSHGLVVRTQQAGLQRDLLDFLDVVPLDRIREIFVNHADNDPEFQNAVLYMQSPEWIAKVGKLMESPKIVQVKMMFKDAGINLEMLEKMAIGLLQRMKVEAHLGKGRSFGSLIKDVLATLDAEAIQRMIDEKLETSEYFRFFYQMVSSDEMRTLIEKVVRMPEFRPVATELIAMDVELFKYLGQLYDYFGWENNLQSVADEYRQ